jgi:ParB family transcriptional regulator, chromosome partitioning protein
VTKDRRLGRGLAALLGTPLDEIEAAGATNSTPQSTDATSTSSSAVETQTATKATVEKAGPSALMLPVDQIDNNPFQPRRQFNTDEIASLAESLKEHQQLQPILVRRVGDRYQLISGERRLRATIHAGLPTIRAEVREADDRLVAELAIIENLQRKDLNPIEKALSFKRYIQEHRCTQEDLAKRLKIDRSTIANFMRLLELPQSILDSVQSDTISAGHARALLPLGDETQQLEFASKIKGEGWSVREIERRVAEMLATEDAEEIGDDGAASRKKSKRPKSDQVASLEQELKQTLGTRVEIRQTSNGRGKIVIAFANADEFNRIHTSLTATSGTRFRLAS